MGDDATPSREEQHKVHDHRFNGRVVSWERDGFDASVDMLAVEEFITVQHGGLTPGAAVSVQQSRRRAEMREEHAAGVMFALADYFGYELTPK